MPVTLTKVPYGGWLNCLRLANDVCELIMTTDVGPRIIRFSMLGKPNMMCEKSDQMGQTGGDEWRIFGGHRLWHSPESMPRSYSPDNSPITWTEIPGGVKLSQATEPWTQLRKEIEVVLSADEAKVHLHHRLVNEGPWTVECSAWALTVLAPGGMEVVPQTRRDTGLLGNRVLALWPYTRMNDPRVTWGDRYIVLHQDNACSSPFKFGSTNEDGWAAMFNHDQLFVKHYAHKPEGPYPDFGVSFETYTNDFMTEMETLSPLTQLQPGGKIDHLEKWELFGGVQRPQNNEAAIEAALKGRVYK